MALTINHPTLKEVVVYTTTIVDSSAAVSMYARAPFRGKIVKMGVVLGAVVDSDRVFTGKINGTAITGGALTVAASGSAAGDVKSLVPTAANFVSEDDTIEIASDGAGSTACVTQGFAVIQVA
jgi:hypothetical protein